MLILLTTNDVFSIIWTIKGIVYSGGDDMRHLSQERLAALVKEKRLQLNYTQEQLSEKVVMNRAMISRLEQEKYLPTISQLERIADVLKFDITELFQENKPTVFTAFRGDNLTRQEQDGVEHLLEMMLVAKQQILLRKAMRHE